jgi:CheY-like chemotaxis protein
VNETHPSVGTLIVDDEDDVRLLVKLLIQRHNKGLFVAGEVSSGAQALETLVELVPEVVVLDQRMPNMDGLETATRILAERPTQQIVLFSAYLDAEIEAAAADVGITACLRKDDVQRLPALLLELARN